MKNMLALCGCHYVEDDIGRVLEVRTCPWCMAVARVMLNSYIDREVSVSAPEEEEEDCISW